MTTLHVAVGGTIEVFPLYGEDGSRRPSSRLLWSTAAINIVGSSLLGLLAVVRPGRL